MAKYLFILGSTPHLAEIEIKSVLGEGEKTEQYTPEILGLDSKSPLDTAFLMGRLGGTVKIARVKKTIGIDNILSEVVALLLEESNKNQRVVFGLSIYGEKQWMDIASLSKLTKEELEKKAIKSRYILPEKNSLTSVQVAKQKVTEIILVQKEDKTVVGITLEVQDFEDWGKRDFGRPASNPKAGMLPPKVARMMINLGIGELKNSPTVLDPFCGVGTIISEAYFLGCNVIAGDIKKEAVSATKKNLEWLIKTYQLPGKNIQIMQKDATRIAEALREKSVDVIVTEPFLGPPIEQRNIRLIVKGKELNEETINNIITGLEKLYKGCLKNWKTVLKKGARVVIIFPSYFIRGKQYPIKNVIDTCENLGYNCVAGPFEYSRPQAIVKRNIYILEYNGD